MTVRYIFCNAPEKQSGNSFPSAKSPFRYSCPPDTLPIVLLKFAPLSDLHTVSLYHLKEKCQPKFVISCINFSISFCFLLIFPSFYTYLRFTFLILFSNTTAKQDTKQKFPLRYQCCLIRYLQIFQLFHPQIAV